MCAQQHSLHMYEYVSSYANVFKFNQLNLEILCNIAIKLELENCPFLHFQFIILSSICINILYF